MEDPSINLSNFASPCVIGTFGMKSLFGVKAAISDKIGSRLAS